VIAPGTAAPRLHGQPVFGLPYDLAAARARGPVLVAFWSALSNAGTLRNLASLTGAWPRADAEAGGIVAVTRSPLEAARDFVPRHHVLFPVLVDESGTFFDAWGVGRASGLAAALVRARPEPLRRALSVLRNGQPLPEAHADQLPAAFLVGRDGAVVKAWHGQGVDDVIPMESTWGAAA